MDVREASTAAASTPLLDRLMARMARLHAARSTRDFLRAVQRATAVQDRLHTELITAGRESAFGRRHHFDRIRTYADYIAQVPVQTYADLSPYIERLLRGEADALLHPAEKILMFALTSGTTAKPKFIPVTRRVLADTRRGWNIWGLKALLDHPECLLRHIVQVTSSMNDHLAPSGAPCGAITGLLAATQKRLVRKYYTSPPAVADISDSTAKYYTIMRLAIPKDVAWMVTANPSTLLVLARTVNERREEMIRDIHDGGLSRRIEVSAAIRAAIAPRLLPDRACARRLEDAVRRTGALYPKDYWRLGFVAHWTGGTMGLYRGQFPKYFGDIPARDIGLIASEGRMSIPMEDGTAAGVLAVRSQFFEFIPAQEYGAEKAAVLRSHEIRPGEEYFLVLSNFSGLYRYDLGDRVRVVGVMGEAPVIEFLSRDAHTCSMAGEKLTEHQVVRAMEQAAAGSGREIVDFVLCPRWAETPYYRLYYEPSDAGRANDLAQRLETALCEINLEYASKRESLRLGPIEEACLPSGTLAEWDRRLRELRSRSSEQFKHQYLMAQPGMDEGLDSAAEIKKPAEESPRA